MSDGEKRSVWAVLVKTYISYAFTGLFLNTVLSVLWIEVFHISKLIAPIINLLFSVPINFLMNKFWAYRKENEK
jgi:putative flippase GtrA